jgi:hypothetical protein
MIVEPWIVELPNDDGTKSCFVGVTDLCKPTEVAVPLHFLWTLLVEAGYEVTRPGWGVLVFVPPKRLRQDWENQIADLQYRKDKADAKWLAEHTDGPADDTEIEAEYQDFEPRRPRPYDKKDSEVEDPL